MRNKKIVAIGAVIILSFSISMICLAGFKKKEKPTQVSQQTESVTKQDLTKSISVTGTITSAASYGVVSELTDTKVNKVQVKVGDRVKKGDVIAELDTSSIEKSLEIAKENLALAQKKNEIDIASVERAYNASKETAAIQNDRSSESTQDAQTAYDKAVADAQTAETENSILEKNRKNKDAAVMEAKNAANSATSVLTEKTKKLAEAQNTVDTLKNNLTVSGNDTAELEEQYQAAINNLSNIQAEYDKAKEDADNKESVLTNLQSEQSEAKSKEEVSDSNLKTAGTNIETTKDALEKAQQESSDTSRSNEKTVADNQDSVTSSQLSASSSVISAQQEVDKYQEQLDDATVKAPADGLITVVGIKEGDTYKGDQIALIQNDSAYKVTALIDQYDISDITQGMSATIETESTGDDVMAGKLTFVSPIPKDTESSSTSSTTSTTTSQEYPVEVAIQNPSDRLRIGMTTKLTIIEQQVKDAYTIPDNCVQTDEDGTYYIEVLNHDIQAGEKQDKKKESDSTQNENQKITVTYGMKTDYYVQIISDQLQEGMQVIVPGETDESASQ